MKFLWSMILLTLGSFGVAYIARYIERFMDTNVMSLEEYSHYLSEYLLRKRIYFSVRKLVAIETILVVIIGFSIFLISGFSLHDFALFLSDHNLIILIIVLFLFLGGLGFRNITPHGHQ